METRRRDDSREATIRLRAGVTLRRRGEAEELEVICDLAVAYRVDEADLLDYGTEIYRDRDTRLPEKLIRPGGEGTPSVSEFLAMEVASLLRCSQTSAIETIASALNLKYRHPMLFEAVINGEVERWLAAKAAWLCRELDPMQAETVTAHWLPRQYGLVPSAALGELKKLIIRADAAAAREREAEARARRGVWLLRLLRPTEAFPFSTRTRRLDVDHNTTYQPGRLGQTRLDNLAQLCRRIHRGKTKGAWVLNQITPGHFRWTSPLGYVYEVTSDGAWLECTPDLGPQLSTVDKSIQDWCDTIADAATLARCS
ncbi:hypothetical protein [Tessaracoccus lacteus]|uniref:DUF222 domain-containing protein n=1 Tax=Tessaracoccus lacteus TaxID=3041766 RepID=A0ABY8PUC8_9ACTN|nr:hypothetical protein [Tessaracoccus sp. T21]WGT46044.1 hypothetical protein QH948_07650 [Tessaracoccus sp. T21]